MNVGNPGFENQVTAWPALFCHKSMHKFFYAKKRKSIPRSPGSGEEIIDGLSETAPVCLGRLDIPPGRAGPSSATSQSRHAAETQRRASDSGEARDETLPCLDIPGGRGQVGSQHEPQGRSAAKTSHKRHLKDHTMFPNSNTISINSNTTSCSSSKGEEKMWNDWPVEMDPSSIVILGQL